MAIPTKMNGVVLEGFKKPYVYHSDLSVPKPRPKEMLLEVKAAGFCHTEIIAYQGDFGGKLPMVPGHETVGVIVEVGAEVKDFKVGDRVGTGLFRRTCGGCVECKRGTSNYCDFKEMAGLTHDGGMAEYVLADPLWTVHLPPSMTFETAAPLMCAGSTIYNSILNANQPKGSILAIVGLGGLGHLGIQFCKAMGHKCVAVDTREAPIALAKTLPAHLQADLIINPKDGAAVALSAISKTFSGASGVAAAIVATDALQAFSFSIQIIQKHGTLVVVGQPDEPIPFHYSVFVSQDLKIVPGGLGQRNVVQEMVDLVDKEGVHVEVKTYGLDDIERLMHDYHDPNMKGKLVVRVGS